MSSASLVVALALLCVACAEPVPIAGARCNGDHPCPGGFVCAGGACRALSGGPTTRCLRDGDCEVGVCLESAGFCVQCKGDADCIQGACLNEPPFQHQCGCSEGRHCATGRCHRPSATCVSCFDDRQCEGGWCDVEAGICRRKVDEGARDAEGTAASPPSGAEEGE